MTILTAMINVLKSIFDLFKTIIIESAKAVTGFYKKHPVIAAYLTGAIAVAITAVVAYNYGANGGKNPFATLHSFTETTTTAQSEDDKSSAQDTHTEAEANNESEAPAAKPLVATDECEPNEISETPIQQPVSPAKNETHSLKGIDVSQHNPPSVWEDKADQFDFVIVKLTEGYTYTDPKATENIAAAKDCNKLIGAYHLVRPDSGVDAVTEANFFVEQLKASGWDHNWLLACDFEPQFSIKKDGKIDYKANADFCKAFLDEVTRLTDGVKPLMYACARDINNGGNNWKAVAASYGLWMAGYPNTETTDSGTFLDSQENMPYQIGSWNYLTIWQYSSAGHLDKDVAYMSTEAWSKFANPTS